MNLEQYIDQVAIGNKPLQKPEERFGIHYACGVKKSGMLTLYVGGRKYASNKCGGGYERKELMKKMIRRVGQINKEMYFVWLPDINQNHLPPLVEKRVKITKPQADQLAEVEQTLNIPASALVRMALNAFLPLTSNKGYTAAGIRSAYNNATQLQ